MNFFFWQTNRFHQLITDALYSITIALQSLFLINFVNIFFYSVFVKFKNEIVVGLAYNNFKNYEKLNLSKRVSNKFFHLKLSILWMISCRLAFYSPKLIDHRAVWTQLLGWVLKRQFDGESLCSWIHKPNSQRTKSSLENYNLSKR